ncbi:TlyA family RNA methyltransferase [Vallitalea guaymasensis]|uniref:TlyA family RNA methyltransferase n=1 Tax=Vallitalea guaymasensis TaxID=1185412 RepID=UPI000DE2B4B4|nr:TlyA family RNA methyltransferase [Vallitalea guaymasensis]
MVQKERLDILLFNKGLADSREKAKSIIMTGNVFVNGEREDKPGTKFDIKSEIIVKKNPNPYVSRGGLKLDKAVKEFGLKLENKVCADVGASTGGFTDCMLQNGAKKVYSIDVGYGQFAWKLRQDERVVCMEKTNVRYVTKDMVNDEMDFVSIDVSFISLTKVLEPVKKLMSENSEMVCLIKPQFEAGREKVGKKGVVRDRAVHEEVIEKIMKYVLSIDFSIKDLSFSPIKGPEGNIEYLLYLTTEGQSTMDDEEIISIVKTVVDKAHEKL